MSVSVHDGWTILVEYGESTKKYWFTCTKAGKPTLHDFSGSSTDAACVAEAKKAIATQN